MTEGYAWCGKIVSLSLIDGADRIESAEVVCGPGGRWAGVVKKGEFSVGDLVEVYVQDALLPRDNQRFAFMENRGWRIRIACFKGAPSECLIMPWEQDFEPVVCDDITRRVGVKKFEREVPWFLAGDMAGSFPSFIPKTDEPNWQSVPHMVEALLGQPYYATIKYDGSSGTAYWADGALHVCSRDWELKDKQGTTAWELARKYDLARWLRDCDDYAIQFEMIGPKIQGNPLGLKSPEIRVFNVWSMHNEQEYGGMNDLVEFCTFTSLPMVEVVKQGVFNPGDDEAIRAMSSWKYPNGTQAEGVVVRPVYPIRVSGKRLSFKIINPAYKEANNG
jgi:RNA ligase (TIGR02306 family)